MYYSLCVLEQQLYYFFTVEFFLHDHEICTCKIDVCAASPVVLLLYARCQMSDDAEQHTASSGGSGSHGVFLFSLQAIRKSRYKPYTPLTYFYVADVAVTRKLPGYYIIR